jgi:hypothetical protein
MIDSENADDLKSKSPHTVTGTIGIKINDSSDMSFKQTSELAMFK